MTESVKIGDRVTHYRYGSGIVERLVSQGLAEVRFGKTLQYVEQNNLQSQNRLQREKKTQQKREHQAVERKNNAELDAQRRELKNRVLSLLEKYDYKSAHDLFQELCQEWWSLSDYKSHVSRTEKDHSQKASEEARKNTVVRERIRKDVRNLLRQAEYEEADSIYEHQCTDWWTLTDYGIEKGQALFINHFVETYHQGTLADLDKIYNSCPFPYFIKISAEDFTTLKLPKLRRHLVEIGMLLDDEQERANARPERRLLIKARAGSGKTRTLCARATLAIRDEKLMPNQVMILAFNKAAAAEVKDRVQQMGKIPNFENARTFHSLAYQLVKPQKKLLFDAGGHPAAREQSRFVQRMMQRILNPAFKEAMIEFFRQELEQIEDIGRDLTPPEYLQFRRTLESVTLRGEFVKSNGEKFIADFLFEHGIEYRYERPWAWKSGPLDGATYKPDFSIVANGRDYILEHWAIDPEDLNATLPDHWDVSAEKYRQQIFNKRDFWLKEGKPLLETHTGFLCNGRIAFENRLKSILENIGIRCQKLSREEVVHRVFENDFTISRIAELFLHFIQRTKKCGWSADEVARRISEAPDMERRTRLFYELALRAHREYELMLEQQQAMDFDDLLVQATEEVETQGASASIHLGQGKHIQLGQIKWILLDEYQDFSELYFKMLDAIVKANPEIRLVAVGDDWQAINAFAGAELRFFEHFPEYFPNAKTVAVTTNYRSDWSVVAAGNRLMDGRGTPAKISRNVSGLIEKIALDDEWIEFRQGEQYKKSRELDSQYLPPIPDGRNLSEVALRQAKALKICTKIISEDPSQKTLILTRTGIIYGMELARFKKQLIRIISFQLSVTPENLENKIDVMTAHGSKGREAHRVIILDVTRGQFPKIHPDNLLFGFFGVTPLSVLEDERRLFYVAITRAERSLYIVTEKGHESPYLDDIQITNPSMRHEGRIEQPPSLANSLGDFAARIQVQLEAVESPAGMTSVQKAQTRNAWELVRTNVPSHRRTLVFELAKAGVTLPKTNFYLPGEDNHYAELAWPDASPPVAILSSEQMIYSDKWISRGWKVPGSNLPLEKIIAGVKHYVFGQNSCR